MSQTKSQAYMEGYQAYMSWAWTGTLGERPANPYQEGKAMEDWQEGWDDASFDV
jgi:ribosome modulation factor